MGKDIDRRFFDADAFAAFRRGLDEEQALLRSCFERQQFSRRGDVAGFELEATTPAIRCRATRAFSIR